MKCFIHMVALEQLGLPTLLADLGVNGALRAAAAGALVGRLAQPQVPLAVVGGLRSHLPFAPPPAGAEAPPPSETEVPPPPDALLAPATAFAPEEAFLLALQRPVSAHDRAAAVLRWSREAATTEVRAVPRRRAGRGAPLIGGASQTKMPANRAGTSLPDRMNRGGAPGTPRVSFWTGYDADRSSAQ